MHEYNGFMDMIEDIDARIEVSDLERLFGQDVSLSGDEPYYNAAYAVGEVDA